MAQIDMNPEEVQEYSLAVRENVKTMHEELDRLVTAFNDLDHIWVFQEKLVVRDAALKDINRLREVLESFDSFGATAGLYKIFEPDGTTYTDILAFTGDYDKAAKGVSKKTTIDFIKFLVKKCTS